MSKSEEDQPFYRNRSWLIGFIVSLGAVLLFYFVAARPGKPVTKPPQGEPLLTAQGGTSPTPIQPEAGWKEGITFTAPGQGASDLLRVGEEVWIFSEEGKNLRRVSLEGKALAETALEKVCGKAAWDGEALWCANMGAEVWKVDPETGQVLAAFETEMDRIQAIAWDGKILWVMGQRGSLASYDQSGKELQSNRVGSYGFARDLTWVGNELWVVYVPPLLARYDASLRLVEKTDQACGLSKDELDYAIDWDGESLWYVDYLSGRVLQCIPTN